MRRVFLVMAVVLFVWAIGFFFSFAEFEIDRQKSDFNEAVIVTENLRGQRFMRFAGSDAVQSVQDFKHPDLILAPYVRVSLAAFSLSQAHALNVLVIGAGAGSMATFARRFVPVSGIDAVEIDQSVVDLASRHFGFKSDEILRVHVADGFRFVMDNTKKYDVILLDAFNGIDVPDSFVSAEFFKRLLDSLAPGGVVASNVIHRGLSPRYNEILSMMNKVFGPGLVAFVDGAPLQRVFFHFKDFRPFPQTAKDRAKDYALERRFPAGAGLLGGFDSPHPH